MSVNGVDQNNDPTVTLTGWDKESLVINPDKLAGNTQYNIKLTSYYKDSASKKTMITLTRKTSIIPSGGRCNLS